MKKIEIYKLAGEFAEDKDIAKELRENIVLPALEANKEVIFDFAGVSATTQSFVHALISEALRIHGPSGIDGMIFRNCQPEVRIIIETVIEYMQEV